MKIKTIARELKNADVRFISLVSRGANRIPFRILKKTSEGESQMIDLTTLRPVLKGEKIPAPAKKATNLPGFAQILGASVSRNIGDTPPKATIAPVQPVQSIARAIPESTPPSVGKPLPQTFNRPKEPLRAERGNAVAFKDLQAAIDSALSARRDQEKREAFERGRSAFARLAPARESDAPRGGVGDAWSLRNGSGKLVQTVLGVRKSASNTMPAGSMRPVTGAALKG